MIDWDAIRQQVPLETLLRRYVDVPMGRKSFRVVCPIHHGDSQNLVVHSDKGKWWCHKCKKGGDVITLYAQIEGLTNGQAAKRLMEQFRVQSLNRIDRDMRRSVQQRQAWTEPTLMPEIEAPSTVPLSSFRSYTPEAIDHFGLRLIPGDDWGCGVYIPITDETGRLVGYSIRQTEQCLETMEAYYGKRPGKYLNSTGLRKSEIVYGLDRTGESIRQAGFVYVVEGQFDAISMWSRGYPNVVALMGSSMSPRQAQILSRYTHNLRLVLDADEAGREASKEIRRVYGARFTIRTIDLPSGTDPESADLNELGV